jgi:hypothetical protein
MLQHGVQSDVTMWGEDQARAFEEVKQALVSQLVLTLLRDQGKFRLKTDALNIVTGAVLSQDDGMYHPVGYASKTLKGA